MIDTTRRAARDRTTPRGASAIVLVVVLALATAFTACQEPAPPDPKLGTLTSAPDSMATAREISASLAGESAPGADAYSYRGLYAGMARSRIEAKVAAAGVRPDTSACHVPPKPPGELACGYDVMLGPDHAHVHLDVTYAPAAANGIRQAREITVTRQLPLDVDGVRVSGALADAFAAQTTLLDTRDATYGHHQAHVRMGTLNGARAHYAEVTVVTHSGREELTVKLGRGPGK